MSLRLRECMQELVNLFESTFTLGCECPEPSSWLKDEMIHLSQETLPIDLRVFMNWHGAFERTHNDWTWYPSHHILRLPTDVGYLLAHRKDTWIVYDVDDGTYFVGQPTGTKRQFDNLRDVLAVL